MPLVQPDIGKSVGGYDLSFDQWFALMRWLWPAPAVKQEEQAAEGHDQWTVTIGGGERKSA
jgi:hypothetical protein